MQESPDLAVDPSSPDAHVEDRFFKQGVDQEIHARYEGTAVEDELRRSRHIRIAATGGIMTVGLVALGLIIWGGPSGADAPATVSVVSSAGAAPAPAVPNAPPTVAPAASAPTAAAPTPNQAAVPANPAAVPANPVAAQLPAPAIAVAAVAAPAPAVAQTGVAAVAEAPSAAAASPTRAPTTAASEPAGVPPTVPAAAPAASGDLEQACRAAFERKKYKDVLDSCGRAFDARPNAADLAALVAEAEMNRGRAGSSLNWARKAIAVDPNLADAYVFLGTGEQQAGHAQAAKTAYLRYLELAPGGRFAQDVKAIVASR
jgi:hypothetical protein